MYSHCSTPVTSPNATFGIKISILPRGYETSQSVKILVENILHLGKVDNVTVKNKRIVDHSGEQIFKTAYIEFTYVNTLNPTIVQIISLPIGTPVKLYTNEINIYEPLVWPGVSNYGPMSHLSLQAFEVVPMNAPLQLGDGVWTSLHIPVLTEMDMINENGDKKRFLPREHLQYLIENSLFLGKVRRIDFVERDDMRITPEGRIVHIDPETAPETAGDGGVLAAFIHMEMWYNNKNTQRIRYSLDTHSQYHVKGSDELDGYHKFVSTYDGNDRYFVFKINHKPIPDADGKLNIHQLAAIKTKLEDELEKLKKENQEMAARLALLEKPAEEEEEKEPCAKDLDHYIYGKEDMM